MINKIDELPLYFAKDYVINEHIVLKQPTIGEIVEFGEGRYYNIAQRLTNIPSDLKSELFDAGVDYEAISDFELFIMLNQELTSDDTRLLLGDLNLSDFTVLKDMDTDELFMRNEATGAVIDRYIHLLITNYICQLHGFKKKVEKAGNEYTKKILIEDDRDTKLRESKKEHNSVLLPLISSLVNSSEFKYKSKELIDVGIYEFMDSVKRIAVIKQVNALTIGANSGMRDCSGLSTSDFDWTRELD